MVRAPDSPDLWAPDSATPHRWAPDSGGHLTLGRAVDLFLAAKAAEGAAAKTLEWYGMILRRAVRGLGEDRPIEQLAGPELRAWILELRSTLSPISVAGYVRTLKVLGNWLAAEELAQAAALRTLRKPRVPDKLVEPISDDAMRRLLAVADVRDRAILLLLLDCVYPRQGGPNSSGSTGPGSGGASTPAVGQAPGLRAESAAPTMPLVRALTSVASATDCAVNKLQCSADDFDRMTPIERLSWLRAFQSYWHSEGWFNNIEGVLQLADADGLFKSGGWGSVVDSHILEGIQDGMRLDQSLRALSTNPGGPLWQQFLASRAQNPSAIGDRINRRMWGAAEVASTKVGVDAANALGLQPTAGERAILAVTDLYRADLKNAAGEETAVFYEHNLPVLGGWLGGMIRGVDQTFVDPRNRGFPLVAGHAVYTLFGAGNP